MSQSLVRRSVAALCVASLAAAAACAEGARTTAPDDAPELSRGDARSAATSLAGTNWELQALGGTRVPTARNATPYLRFGAAGSGTFSTSLGCNVLGGSVRFDDRALAFSAIASTRIHCGDLAGWESRLHYVLAGTTHYVVRGQALVLVDARGRTLAQLTAAR